MANIYDLTDTWNDGAVKFTSIKMDVTDTASLSTSNLLDLQVSSTTQFSVGKTGDVDAVGAYQKGGATILDANAALAVTAVGDGALADASLTGVNNTAIGYQSAFNTESGTSNTTTGHTSFFANTTGAANVATGRSALFSNVSGDNNVAAGFQSLYNNVGADNNVATGYQSAFNNTSGHSNVASGYRSLFSNTVGIGCTSTGFQSLFTNSNGNYNTATGYQSLYSNSDGNYNTATGYRALYANTSGVTNLALSREALRFNTTGNYNVAAGYRALYENVDGSYNVALGRQSMQENVSGDYNTAVGYLSLYNLTSGDDNVALGSSAGRYQADGVTALTTADDSIFIGTGSRGVTAATNQIVIGDTAIGLGSNTTVLGSAATTLTRLQGDVGIGTDSPPGPLGVYQDDAATGSNGGVTIEQDGAGDCLLQFLLSGTERWMMGVDNSDSDKFKIEDGSALSSGAALTIDTASNVGIGTASPNANAILDVTSTTKAFLPPRMTTTQKNAVSSPTAGMVVYDSTLSKLAVYTGSAWEAVTSA